MKGELFKPWEVKNIAHYSKDTRRISVVERESSSGILHSIPSEAGLHVFKCTGTVEVCIDTERWISGLKFTAGSYLYLRIREHVAARSPKEARQIIKLHLANKAQDESWREWNVESLNVTFTKKRTKEAALNTCVTKIKIHKSAQAYFGSEEADDSHLIADQQATKGTQMNLL